MDKAIIKTMLGSYRSGGQEARDPVFAGALREVERDPELAAWFVEEQRFDSQIVATFRQTPIPTGLKELILLNAAVGKPSSASRKRPIKTWMAIAAGLMLAFLLGRQMPPNVSRHDADGTHSLALRAIAYTAKMPALQFVCFDASAVAGWVQEKSAALHMGNPIDKPMSSMQMIGSSTAQWEGKPVIMIALQNGDRMAMLYVLRLSDFPGAAKAAGEVTEKDGWVSKTGRSGESLYVLTAKGTRENLNFPMPL